MTSQPSQLADRRRGLARLAALALVLLVEAVMIVAAFQVLTTLDCRDTGLYLGCRALRLSMVQGLCLAIGAGIYLAARPDARAGLRSVAAGHPRAPAWALVHAAGLVAVFAPLALLDPGALAARFGMVLPLLAGGAVALVAGGLFWLAPPRALWGWARAQGWALPFLLAVALALPPLADEFARLWYWGPLAKATFAAVAAVLSLFADALTVVPDQAIIGAGDFVVAVASQCSGVEGLALTTAFLGVYAVLFRDTLRQGRFWAVVFPLSLLASWCFNVLRITALILIGASGAPELALNGFHSFAGWLSFTVLVLLILIVAHTVPWLQRDPPAGRAAVSAPDRAVERILPFVAFMLASVAVNAFFAEPALAYPMVAGAMVLALLLARTGWTSLDWRADPVAIAAGLGVAALWLVTAPPAPEAAGAVAQLTGAAAAGWIAVRILGTALLVPMVEELFFRGYVQARIDTGGTARRIAAIAVSAMLFAALHDRWIVAAAAGVVFSLVMLRRGRLADAIVAHAVANLVIAAAAAYRGDWTLI